MTWQPASLVRASEVTQTGLSPFLAIMLSFLLASPPRSLSLALLPLPSGLIELRWEHVSRRSGRQPGVGLGQKASEHE